MRGLMQDYPLAIPSLFRRAEKLFGDKEVVTSVPGGRERTTYAAWAERTRRLGGVLDILGISDGGRVATFAWNSARHLELYFAVPCTGRVLHTLNVRLFPAQVAYIVQHAHDEAVFVDRSLLGMLWPVVKELSNLWHIVVMDDGQGDIPDDPRILVYEDLLAEARPVDFLVDDENRAAGLAYTSGTTGNPRGVLYSHRSTVLHTLAIMTADVVGVCERDVVLPVVPMFHANAWGLAHAAVTAGSTLVLPGADLSPANIVDLVESERVTVAAGVPTIWMGVLPLLDGRDVASLRALPCGGSAVPAALSEGFRAKIGLPILQAWGMTETSPVASVGQVKSTLAEGLSDEELAHLRSAQGLPLPLVEARITEPGTTDEVAWDGEASGELQVRGPWVAAAYYNDDRSHESFTRDGWLRTGDVATISAEGYIRLVDRTKDLIKSGGEWISSVLLENEIMSHPDVFEAAVIGVAHQRWQERPLACVVTRPGAQLSREDILSFLEPRVAKWWLPDDVVFIDSVPKTSVGKFSKKDLRARFAGHRLP